MNNLVGSSDNKTVGNIEVPELYAEPFIPAKAEKIALIFSYPIAFLYTYIFMPAHYNTNWYAVTAVFTALFCISAEIYYHRYKATMESYIWLGCVAVILVSAFFGRNRVWGDGLALFFVHCYAVYWILNRSGRITEGRSGPFLPVDIINGFFTFPFKYFFLRIKVLWSVLTSGIKKNQRKKSKWGFGSFAAVLAGIILFCAAIALLSSADDVFNRVIIDILIYIFLDFFNEHSFRFFISLLVGAYLYGLIIGTNREEPNLLRKKGDHILQKFEKLRKVPTIVWTFILGAFGMLYLLFFFIQGSYLFGAFTRTLPEGFTVARYARQGFFELCWIMGINFLLVWLVARSSMEDIRNNRPAMIICSVLLTESILFAITAFSKLMLYISCFGFTPRRLQSAWLICVLFIGSALVFYSLWTRKRSFRIWVFISGISLALMHLF